jgi:hypothetical protein
LLVRAALTWLLVLILWRVECLHLLPVKFACAFEVLQYILNLLSLLKFKLLRDLLRFYSDRVLLGLVVHIQKAVLVLSLLFDAFLRKFVADRLGLRLLEPILLSVLVVYKQRAKPNRPAIVDCSRGSCVSFNVGCVSACVVVGVFSRL